MVGVLFLVFSLGRAVHTWGGLGRAHPAQSSPLIGKPTIERNCNYEYAFHRQTYSQRVLNDLSRARLSRDRMIWILARPLLPLPSTSSTGDTQKNEEERQLANGRGVRVVGEEPNNTSARQLGPL